MKKQGGGRQKRVEKDDEVNTIVIVCVCVCVSVGEKWREADCEAEIKG